MHWTDLEHFQFGDNPALADDLAALVLAGRKRATCWSAADGQKTEVGKCMVMCDGSGRPRAVLETIELSQRRYDAVDTDFAHDEGEGDLSLDHWRAAHRRFFTRTGGFDPNMMLWCERFRLVQRID